jgi:hypothetical protein
MRKAVIAAVIVAAVVLVLVVVAWLRPPELIRVGAGYTAKIVCSNVFLAGRDAEAVLQTDVQAPGNPLLRLMRVSVDPVRGEVRAGLFGFIGGGLAVFRRDTGCTVLPDGKLKCSRLANPRIHGGTQSSSVAASVGSPKSGHASGA